MPERDKEDAMKRHSTFAIGIEAIDKQHLEIFEHLLAIENSTANRESAAYVKKEFPALVAPGGQRRPEI